MTLKMLITFTFLYTIALFGQGVSFYGEMKPGNLVIGQADNLYQAVLNDTVLPVDSAGLFVFGFDRDDRGDFYLKLKYKDGHSYIKKIKLPERKYREQRINNMKKKYVQRPDSEIERIREESRQIREARKTIGEIKEPLYKKGFKRPVEGGWVSSVFGSQRVLNGVRKNAHNGYDIAAAKGTPVYAMTDGRVVFAADTFYYAGNFILLDHGQGLNSMYLHLSKKDVKEGDMVKKGEKIGEIGTTGRSTGPHLHWGVQWYGKRVDPYPLLKMPASFE